MAAPQGIVLPHARAWRERLWLTQGELAKAAGVKPGTVWRAEHGDAVSVRTVRELAKALGITPEQLRDVAPEMAKVAV